MQSRSLVKACPHNVLHFSSYYWLVYIATTSVLSSVSNNVLLAFCTHQMDNPLLYCPSIWSGQYCQSRAEYFPVLPSRSCNNIYVSLDLL